MTKAAELAKMGEVLTNSQIGGRRNIVINGAMQVAQRATSVTGLGGDGNTYNTCDRWHLSCANTAGRFTMSQAADVHDGFANALKFDCTTADTSIAAGEFVILTQRFEGQDVQQFKKGSSDAESITVSFYVKGNASATYALELFDNDNSRQASQLFSVTTDWTRVIKTFTPDTTGAFDDDNATSLELNIFLHAGSNLTSGTLSSTFASNTNANRAAGISSFFDSTDRTFFITGVQMEVGEQATPFEHRSFGEELDLCYRYYIKYHAGGSGTFSRMALGFMRTSTNLRALFTYPREMRSTPALDDDNAGNYHVEDAGGNSDVDATVASISQGGLQTCLVNFTTGSLTNNDPAHVGINSSTDSLVGLGFDAEL
tara:strand:- start:139 stop:1251 length:1113 start_codon:yes stop_codon:yes gene_type:complete